MYIYGKYTVIHCICIFTPLRVYVYYTVGALRVLMHGPPRWHVLYMHVIQSSTSVSFLTAFLPHFFLPFFSSCLVTCDMTVTFQENGHVEKKSKTLDSWVSKGISRSGNVGNWRRYVAFSSQWIVELIFAQYTCRFPNECCLKAQCLMFAILHVLFLAGLVSSQSTSPLHWLGSLLSPVSVVLSCHVIVLAIHRKKETWKERE